ncbi:mannose-6-phosphate isomerase [Venturia nashicola]|uniref:Mannose-6-phosphate isomerase n=1 Tax=Venturia nashicola TaxID=86259 RepID=A0A4Z1P8P0_9PEZI|nr:mannose-6-phosphate isomerase [Venturia nashicola]
MVESVIQLKCLCNNYPWGKKGKESLAAQLCEKTPGTDFNIDENKDYAEMWMGTYPELPSYVLATGENLQHVIDKHAEELFGKTILNKFGHKDLPFLPKVLSIAKALPLQLHPNKELAAKLHARDPNNFTDPNHKPEIALALGPFEAFCGFKPLVDIDRLLDLEPLRQFRPMVRKPAFDDQSVKHVVKAMLTASDEAIQSCGEQLQKIPKENFGRDTYIPSMIERLWSQYDKTDPGTLVALITMNYMKLNKGDSIYIPADGIHAYLSGDIIECMARSNNVLNTGFCPSAERNNVNTFTDCLTFTPHSAEEAMLEPRKFARAKKGKTLEYAPPLSEFSVLGTELGKGESETIGALGGPSILIATHGNGKMKAKGMDYDLKEGYIFFIGYGVEMEFEAESGLQIFTAFVE